MDLLKSTFIAVENGRRDLFNGCFFVVLLAKRWGVVGFEGGLFVFFRDGVFFGLAFFMCVNWEKWTMMNHEWDWIYDFWCIILKRRKTDLRVTAQLQILTTSRTNWVSRETKKNWTSKCLLVGGFNPFEKYESNWVHLPQFSGWKCQKIFELPPPFFLSVWVDPFPIHPVVSLSANMLLLEMKKNNTKDLIRNMFFLTCGFLRSMDWSIEQKTLQGTNISHLGKRKIIFKMPFLEDMLVPWRVIIWDL